MDIKIMGGLQPTPEDKNRFKTGSFFGPAKLTDIPLKDFRVGEPANVKNQGQTMRCAGYATATTLELTEKEPLSGDFVYGLAKEIDGDQNDGTNLQIAAKVATKIGAIEEKEWKESLNDEELKKWWNWKEKYVHLAVRHRQKSYFEVTGPYDFFDNIRSNMWKHKLAVLTGTYWYDRWGYKTTIDKIEGSMTGGHAISVYGQKIINGQPYLIIKNSGGSGIGINGEQYFSREVVNKCFKPYGGFIFVDLDPEEVKKLMTKESLTLIDRLLEIIKNLLGSKKKKYENLS